MLNNQDKKIIGRLEQVNLPEFNLFGLDAKIDTGAYSGSLHAHEFETRMEEDEKILTFKLLDPEHPEYNEKTFETKDFFVRKVKSSNGESVLRYFIRTILEMSGEEFEVELSLADRSSMKWPILIGRKNLTKRFLIDVDSKFNSQ